MRPGPFAIASAIVIALGAILRFVNLDGAVYWHDEAITSLWLSGHSYADLMSGVLTGKEIGIADLARYQHAATDVTLLDALQSAAAGEPQTPPLFLALLWGWTHVFGDSISAIRSLPATLSLITLPAIYWLGRELFRSRITAVLGVALVSISPFQIAYAREARSYSLWMLLLVLSTAALLSAIRRPSTARWTIYAATATLALYAHLLSVFVIAAHVGFVVGTRERSSSATPVWLKHLAAVGVSVALFVPWIVTIARHQSTASETLDWLSSDVGHFARAISWGGGLIRNVVDFGWSDQDVGRSPAMTLALALTGLAVLGLVSSAIYRLRRAELRRQWLLVVLLIASVAPVMILPDVLAGGRRSTIARYLTPGYLGITLAVASLISTQLTSGRRRSELIGAVTFALLATGGLASGLLTSRADHVWTKGLNGKWAIDVANAVNAGHQPLLVSDASKSYVGNLLALSHRLDPGVRLQLVFAADRVAIRNRFDDIFLFRVSDALRKDLTDQLNAPFELIDARTGLWRYQAPAR